MWKGLQGRLKYLKRLGIPTLSNYMKYILFFLLYLLKIIETDKELYMVMEYCMSGELFDYIVQN